MKDIVIGDKEFAGDWVPFYHEVAEKIRSHRNSQQDFYHRLDFVCAELNRSGLFVDRICFEQRLGRFALYEMLMRDFDETQRRFVQQTIKKMLEINEPAPRWFPFVKPLEKPVAEIFQLDYWGRHFPFEERSWETYDGEKEFADFFNSSSLNRECRRIVTTWLYLSSPTSYIGLDDWMSDFLMNGRVFWIEHHPESLLIEYLDVVNGLPRADRYFEWLDHMSESVSNSMFDGAYYALSYAAYRNAVEKYKQEDGARLC